MNNLKRMAAFCVFLVFFSQHAKAMDRGHLTGSSLIVPTALTASAFIHLLFRLLAVDRPDIIEADFDSKLTDDLNTIFDWFFTDDRNFRNVRRQIHENLALTALGEQVSIDLYLLPVLCIGTGTSRSHIYSQPRGTILADCDVSIDCNPRLSPHHCCDAWEVSSLPFNTFGCIFFAHAGQHPPLHNLVNLITTLSIYYCSLLPGGVFIYNSVVFDSADAPDQLAQRNGYSSFDNWKQQWILPFFNIGFVDIEIMIKRETKFLPTAVSILLVARKEL